MHPRLSVHSVAFTGSSPDELEDYWRRLGVKRLSINSAELLDPQIAAVVARGGYAIESVTQLFVAGPLPIGAAAVAAARDSLSRTIDAAAKAGARCLYLLTGGRGALTWEAAAETFSAAVAPCAQQARQAGVALLIENASNLYVDIHIAHTLRDTITLAEMADIGICIDHFHGWTEAGFEALVERAMPRTGLIQLSDYVPGDRALPARAVPGDGAIPIQPFVEQALGLGYAHGFDLELLGPRIEREGRLEAVRRAAETVGAMLGSLGV